MSPASDFPIDSRLASDTVPVGRVSLCEVLLMDDANYPWLVLVPRVPQAVELIDLGARERSRVMEAIALASTVLKRETGCDKLNVAALGNQVSQLHVHVIARFHSDPAWPGPVWGKVPPVAYDPAKRDALVARLSAALDGAG